jgi:hypothetical protein
LPLLPAVTAQKARVAELIIIAAQISHTVPCERSRFNSPFGVAVNWGMQVNLSFVWVALEGACLACGKATVITFGRTTSFTFRAQPMRLSAHRVGELDQHFGFPVVAGIEEANEHFRVKLHELLDSSKSQTRNLGECQ